MFYVYLFAGYVYCDLTSSFMALKITIFDLKFLSLTVEEWDNNEGTMKRNNEENTQQAMKWNNEENTGGTMKWNNEENTQQAMKWNNEENTGGTMKWNNEENTQQAMKWNNEENTGGTMKWNNEENTGGTMKWNNEENTQGTMKWNDEENSGRTMKWSREGSKYVAYNKENARNDNTSLMRSNIVSVIKLHDMICRRSSSMNRDFEMIYTIYNNTICFQICVCLYTSAKENDIIHKAENILHMIPLAGILFLYCFYSQEILNEGERFRTKLWNSSFVDKPRWYRSSLLIIMIRNSKELEMKPFGCYALNLKTFSVVMKAAYSYFNMLNSLKKRI
ncbi:hypothetical protein LSTR_LSTR014478 [Laodelphax striatellus]|uniref:Odorant receptor n=1 Tax=Laodelphax striatellus TaxID=195883 RepID=A0A482WJU1_LAOST|nr:hypothetical protein LSTR_LSTR014478 [Laodelphax striatellus]